LAEFLWEESDMKMLRFLLLAVPFLTLVFLPGQSFAIDRPAPETDWGLTAAYKLAADSCCNLMGDANNNGAFNILDLTFIVGFLFKNGPAPACPAEADLNCDCTVNVRDITYIIYQYYYGGIFNPCNCDIWNGNCNSGTK